MDASNVKRFVSDYPAVVFLGGLLLVFSLFVDRFVGVDNFQNIGRQSAVVMILAFGMMFAMLTAGIDLSVGSTAALTGAIAAWVAVEQGWGTWWGIVAGLGVGAIAGLVNGLLVAKLGIVPFVTTLATLTAFRSLTLLLTDGRPIAGLDSTFREIAEREVFGFPLPFLIALAIGAVSFVILRMTATGLRIYAVGGGSESARLSGVNVDRITIGVYVVSGVTAAVGGILLTSRVASAQPNAAVGIELDVITAAVLGGVSLFGGKGRVLGAVTGALAITVLGNGLNLLQVDAFLQEIIKGAALLGAVLLARRAAVPAPSRAGPDAVAPPVPDAPVAG